MKFDASLFANQKTRILDKVVRKELKQIANSIGEKVKDAFLSLKKIID